MQLGQRIRTSSLVLAAVGALPLAGCASMNNTQKGAVIGATVGGAAGGMIGRNNGSTAAGVIIGATIGGAAGAMIGERMNKQAREIAQDIPGAKVERVGEGIKVTFDSGILFDFDSDALRAEARTNLRNLAASLDRYPDTDLYIVGHTDDVGPDDYNQRLSLRRAMAASSYLIAQGVDRTRIRSDGLGESEPVQPNTTESGRQSNRRVEVAIYANEAYRREMKAKFGGI